MGYVIEGVIGPAASLRAGRGFVHAVVVALAQELYLLPMTASLFDELSRGDAVDPRFAQCRGFPSGFDTMLAEWSMRAPVAYVEADFHGGIGKQFAAVWQGGELVLGPLLDGEDAPPATVRRSAISQALHRLGARKYEYIDEFDAIGLGRHRHVDDWLDDQL